MPSKVLGIATCLAIIGYCVYLLIDPVGYIQRFKLPVSIEGGKGAIMALRVFAVLTIAVTG